MSESSVGPGPSGDVHWKRYLALIWLSQCLFQLSFSFGIPFVPFFMQEIGVSKTELPFWVALFGGTPSLAILVFSPFWGMMANRFGCKKMLLRCYIGGVVVLCGIALCSSPQWMIVFRLLQGIVCGSVPVALTLASSLVPKDRVGFALGVVNSSTFSGLLFGSFFGGIAADIFGYRMTFLLSGIPTALSVLIMIFGVKEYFTPPPKSRTVGNPLLAQWKKMSLTHWQFTLLFPILLMVSMTQFGRMFDHSFLALFVQEIHGGIKGAATWTGVIQALAGTAGVLAGLAAGYMSDRFDPGKTAMTMAGISVLLMVSVAFTPCMGYLVLTRTLANFAIDCIEPSLQVWLCRKVSLAARNIAFAWAQSIRSIGGFVSPLAAGMVVRYFGLRPLFIGSACIFLCVMLLSALLYRRERSHSLHHRRQSC
ncbi:MAG: MFS transporter [Lentisphaeria bacterium]|nr:MFS transporter [Lentisphaeria bacterium]